MSKIIALSAENVKRLKVVRIAPQECVTTICGENESGKTSVLDSIVYALAGERSVPPKPVRDGAERGQVVVELDNGLIITRTFTSSGNSYLKVVSGADGEVKSPQKILDGLYGKLTFDPLSFMLMESAKQADTLRRLANLDALVALEGDRKKLYEERTRVNRELDQMRGAVAALPHYPDAPAGEVSSKDLLAQIEVAQRHNQQQAAMQAAVDRASLNLTASTNAIRQTATTIAGLEKQLAALRKQHAGQVQDQAEATQALNGAQEELARFTPVNTDELKHSLSACEEMNRKVRANLQRAKAVEDGQAKRRESEAITEKIEKIDLAKQKALEEANFPVPGLGINGDVVTMNDIPLQQCSAAQRLRISVAIAAALNPELRIMLVRDGSLLDDKNLAALTEMAKEMDIQVWLERVGVGSGECSVILEDGEAVGGTCVMAAPVAVTNTPPRRAGRQDRSEKPEKSDKQSGPRGEPEYVDVPLDTVPPGADF